MADRTGKRGGSIGSMFMEIERRKLLSGICFVCLPQIESLENQLELPHFRNPALKCEMREILSTQTGKNILNHGSTDDDTVSKIESINRLFNTEDMYEWIHNKYIYGDNDRKNDQVWSLILLKANRESINNSSISENIKSDLIEARLIFSNLRQRLRSDFSVINFTQNANTRPTVLESQLSSDLIRERAFLICSCNAFCRAWSKLRKSPPESLKDIQVFGSIIASEIGIPQEHVSLP